MSGMKIEALIEARLKAHTTAIAQGQAKVLFEALQPLMDRLLVLERRLDCLEAWATQVTHNVTAAGRIPEASADIKTQNNN